MRVTIWDLDYYYAKEKINCFNTDVMRISSYHKQKGDTVNFVLTENDIRRPYDLYYIIKENNKTPNPPIDFYANPKVRWWGNANKMRINWKMDRVILSCRPDYLLYPEKNTRQERAEFIRLFDNTAKPLVLTQDYKNSYKNKDTIVVDKYMWLSSKNNIIDALNFLKEIKNISFLEPIRLDLIIDDKDIINKFFELKLTQKSVIQFTPIKNNQFDAALDFFCALKEKFPHSQIKPLVFKYDAEAHWDNVENAKKDFNNIKTAIIKSKKMGVKIISAPIKTRLSTPYYHLFEELNKWTQIKENISWYEYLLRAFPDCRISNPNTWNEPYRDLLRQTYFDKEFLLIKWKNQYLSENEVPWELLKKEFKYEI